MMEIPEGQESKLFSSLALDLGEVTTMRVKPGSKVRNLLGFALKKIKEATARHIIFTGSGPALSKTVTCVEIIKRNMKNLHQVSKIFYRRETEYWDPKETELDRLKVTRHIPAIAILLSKESLDTTEPGYQAPGSHDALWTGSSSRDGKTPQSRKRTNSERIRQTKRSVKSAPSSSSVPKAASGDRDRRKPTAKKNQKPSKGNVQTKTE